LKITLQLSASSVGLLMIGLMLSSTLSAGWAGQHLKRTGRYTLPPRLMLPVTAVGLAGLAGIAGLRAEMTPALATFLLALVGVGIGPMFPVSIVSAQNAVERHDIGTVTGTMSFVRGFAGAVGTTAASALVIGLMAAWVPSTGALTELEDIVRQELSATERIEAARAFGVLFAVVCAVILAGLVAFTRVADRPLSDRPVAGPPGAG
ncbi:MAG: MFS transporter, partial [Alphaproteobacteria bacterium]|nr:MFS transporter [Alphaproteobacteria bacterium]